MLHDGAVTAAAVTVTAYGTHTTTMRFARIEGAQRRTAFLSLLIRLDPLLLYIRRGEAGIARLSEDGSVRGGPPGTVPRVLAEPGALGPCTAAAEGQAVGAFSLLYEPRRPIPMSSCSGGDNTDRVHLVFGFERGRLCYRGAQERDVDARVEHGRFHVSHIDRDDFDDDGHDVASRITCPLFTVR